MNDSERLEWSVAPEAVFRLGQELITDRVQALVELIKNAYDADSDFALVEIEPERRVGDEFPEAFFPNDIGYVCVMDEGEGMTRPQIRDGWLRVGESPKRVSLDPADPAAPHAKQRTKKGRWPMGDKGLGRLGAQLLGDHVQLWTKREGVAHVEHVGFDWSAFVGKESWADIPIEEAQRTPEVVGIRQQGTKLVISSASNERLLEWAAAAKRDLPSRLSELVSPFVDLRGFDVAVTVGGEAVEPYEFEPLRPLVDVEFGFEFDGEVVRAEGRVKLRALRAADTRGKQFDEAVSADRGAELRQHLLQQRTGSLTLSAEVDEGWFLRFDRTVRFDQIDPDSGELELEQTEEGPCPISPGPLTCQVHAFDRRIAKDALVVLDEPASSPDAGSTGKPEPARSKYRRLLDALWGVRVYRDGFGIKTDRDFLALAKAFTGSKSFYSLRPANVIGYVSLSVEHNSRLKELTNREGFHVDPVYRNFLHLRDWFVRWTSEVLHFLRRGTNDYCDELLRVRADLEGDLSVDDLAARVRSTMKGVPGIRDDFRNAARRTEAARTRLREVLGQAQGEGPSMPQELRDAVSALDNELEQVPLDRLDSNLDEIELFADRFELLQRRLERFGEQMGMAVEALGVALVAEIVAHDLQAATDRLAEETRAAERQLKGQGDVRPLARRFVRGVRSVNRLLRTQIAHLNPALRYARDRRERLDLGRFLAEHRRYCAGRWEGSALRYDLVGAEDAPVPILCSEGKLLMVFDNLILNNSEHWVRLALRLGRIEEGQVRVEVDPPFVEVSDNGPGVDPPVEDHLFDPYVTTKTGGRGLGLFIVRELLDEMGCAIDLLPSRNAEGRRYVFRLDLSELTVKDNADG